MRSRSSPPIISCYDFEASDAATLDAFLLKFEPQDRRDVIGNAIQDAFDSKANHVGRLSIQEEQLVGAIITKNLGGGASVISAAAIDDDNPATADWVWADIYPRLHSSGIRFIQWMRGVEQEDWLPLQWGFHRLATLDYLSASAAKILASFLESPEPLSTREPQFQRADSISTTAFTELMHLTYQDSLDCPEFFRYRTAAEVIESYRQVSGYDIADWYLLSEPSTDKPLGCLIVTPYKPSHILELTYMGLIPEARRRGFSRAILKKAATIGIQKNLEQIVLAVDRENTPAQSLYRSVGMETIFAETAWVRKL